MELFDKVRAAGRLLASATNEEIEAMLDGRKSIGAAIQDECNGQQTRVTLSLTSRVVPKI